ncbi:MAG: hemerythrin family protein [Desulfovibrionaceae bacterium]|nr:hemerythrin family protein [Desulfovibrionaceae bacterium]
MASNRNSAGTSTEYVIDIREIDEQHERIFDILDRIETVAEDLYRPLDDDEVDDALDIMGELRECAREHFGTEEGYMEEADYPALDDHRAAHEKFIDDLIRMEGELLNGSSVPPVKIHAFLAESCREHILSMDSPFGDFYNKIKK